MTKTIRGTLFVILSAFCYGLMPTITKQIYDLDISVLATITIRFIIAFSALGIFLFIKNRKLLHLERSKIRTYLILGASYLSVIGLTLSALKYAPVAIVILILYTYPVLILFYKIFSKKERLDIRIAGLLFGSLFGMVLLLGSSFKDTSLLGIFLSFCASMSFAYYVLTSEKKVANDSPFTLGFYTYAVAAAIISIVYLSTKGFVIQIITASIIPFLLLGIGTTIIPSLLFLQGLKLIPATKAASLAMMEPLFAILFAFLLNNEALTPAQIFGGTILFVSSFLISFKKS